MLKKEIQLEEQGYQKMSARLFKLVMAFLFCGLFLFYFLSVTSLWVTYITGGALAICFSVFLQYVKIFDKKKFLIENVIVLGIIMIAGFIFRKRIINGGVIYINEIIKNWNERNGSVHYMFVTNNETVSLDVVLYALLVTLVSSAIINYAIRLERSEIVLLIIYIAFVTYMLIASKPSLLAMFVTSVVIVLYLSFEKMELDVARQSKSFWIFMMCSVMFITGLSFAFCSLIPDDRMDIYRGRSVKLLERAVYGEPDLVEGDISKLKSRDVSGDTRLNVHSELNGLVYLKGYVGSKFRAGKWTELDNEAYSGDNSELIHYMIENKSSPLIMLNTFYVLSNQYEEDTFEYTKQTLKIENTGASKKYIYVPYTLANMAFSYYDNVYKDQDVRNSVTDIHNQYEIVTGNVNSNELITLYDNGVLKKAEDNPDVMMMGVESDYFDLEQAYRDYTIQYYMDVPDSISCQFDESLEPLETNVGVETITTYIREYLKDTCKYSDELDDNRITELKNSNPTNYLLDFFNGEAGGYSVSYATIATLMYRYYGIPARYVEGYRCELGVGNNNILDKDAHAWVEVYRYGMGWVPIDVTPGFYKDSIEPELSETTETAAVTPPEIPDESQVEVLDENPLKDKEDEIREDPLWNVVKIVLGIIGIIILSIIIIFIRKHVIEYNNNKRIRNEDLCDAVLFMAGKLWFIFGKRGLEIDRGLPLKSKDDIDETYKLYTKVEYEKIDEILMKAKYSGQQIAPDEYILVKAYYDFVKEFNNKKNKLLKDLLWKYIYVIY